MPNRIEILKDMFWSGELNDCEFCRLASDAGMTAEQIADFITEVRQQDEVA